MSPLILGSSSPRRKEILSFFTLPFVQAVPIFDEDAHPFLNDPIKYATELSEGKSLSIAPQDPKSVIVTADTVVYKQGKLYAKPANLDESHFFISSLQGGWHSVFTSITGRIGKKMVTEVEETKVLFHPLTRNQIEKYCAAIETHDKAGGYAIQGKGAVIVKRIEGCYYNVMGLPINNLQKVLLHFDIDLWKFLR